MINKESRRKFIQKTGILTVWTTPLLTVVSLPIHAMTSVGGLVDATPPPPGFFACEISSTLTIATRTFAIRNTSPSTIVISAISVVADKGISLWLVSTPLPISIGTSLVASFDISSSPLFTCSDAINPRFTVTYTTDQGVFVVNHT